MARPNSILALVCLALSLQAQAQDIFPGPIMRTIGAGASYLIDQDFEGAGYDNGETWTEAGAGTIDEDYTGTVLDGTQSLQLAGTSAAANTSSTFGNQSEVWMYALFRLVNLPGSTENIINLRTTGGADCYIARINTSGQLTVANGPTATCVTTVSTGTTYHIWCYYKTGTGANAILNVAFSTTGIRPTSGNNFAQVTTGTAATDPDRIRIGTASSITHSVIFDKIRVDNVQIGDNPP